MSLDEDRFGRVTRNGDLFDLAFERRFAAGIDKVWAAITTPARIADWFGGAEVEIEPRLGGAYRLRWGADTPFTEGEITAFDPPRLLEHTWPQPPNPPGIVRYELEPDGAGCRLVLINRNVPAAYIGSLAGWHIFLDAIGPATDGVALAWTMEAENELMAVYRRRIPGLPE